MSYRGLSAIVTRAPLEITVPRFCPGMKKFMAPPLTDRWTDILRQHCPRYIGSRDRKRGAISLCPGE